MDKSVKKVSPKPKGRKKKSKEAAVDWVVVKEKIPFGDDSISQGRRKKLWKRVDVNGNGLASLAEVDRALSGDLCLGEEAIVAPVLMRAFQAARNINRVLKILIFSLEAKTHLLIFLSVQVSRCQSRFHRQDGIPRLAALHSAVHGAVGHV